MRSKKKSDNKRIVYLSTSLGVGGAAKRVLRLSVEARHRRWRVKVATLLPLESKEVDPRKIEKLRREGVECISAYASKNLFGLLKAVRFVFYIAKEKPDIVHSNSSHANILARFVKLFAPSTKVVSTVVNYKEGGLLLELFYKITDFICDVNVHLTDKTKERYVRKGINGKDKTIVIPNGVSLLDDGDYGSMELKAKGACHDSFKWVCVAALHEKKDHLNLLDALLIVKQRSPDFSRSLYLLGDGPMRPDIESFVIDNALSDEVFLYGVCENPVEILKECDAFVLSSRREGHSNALLEALAVGLPVVCTDVGGNPDLVIPEENGFLVPKEDPEKLSDAMLGLESMAPGERHRLGANSKKIVTESFTDERFYEDWFSLYSDLTS